MCAVFSQEMTRADGTAEVRIGQGSKEKNGLGRGHLWENILVQRTYRSKESMVDLGLHFQEHAGSQGSWKQPSKKDAKRR